MPCQSCPLNGHSCSNPVHSNHQYRTESTHAGRQAVTTVREPFSPQFPFSQRVRSMKSVSFTMLKTKKDLRKLEFGRHLKPCAGKILWLLMLLFDGFQESCCYQESRGLFRLRAKISRALSNFHHAGRTNREKTCRCQASDHCEWTTLSTVSIFAKGQINEECFFRNVENWAWKTAQTLCWEELELLMLLCDRLPGILLLPATRNHVACSGSRMSRASNNFCHAGRTNICSRSMSCQSWKLNGHSCSKPVHSNHQYRTESTCRCQAATTVRDPFSPQFPFLQRLRSMKSVSYRNVENWAWKTAQTLWWENCFVPDAAVWQASTNLIASSYQESHCLCRFENEPSVKQLLPCWKNEHLLSFNVLPGLPIEWAFVQQSSPQ